MAIRDDERQLSRQLANQLRAEIGEGAKYVPGGRLPSYRELADTHGVAKNTVQVAVRLLEQQGLIEIRGTAGAYVRDRANDDGPHEPEIRAELVKISDQLRQTQLSLDEVRRAVSDLMRRLPGK